MIIINSFDLSEIHIGKITIPRLESNRYETITVLLLSNFKNSISMLLIQSDGFNANTIKRLRNNICFFITDNDNWNNKRFKK